MLNPMSPPSKSLRLAVGTPTQRVTNEHNQILLENTNTRLFSKGYSRVLMVKQIEKCWVKRHEARIFHKIQNKVLVGTFKS